MIEMIETIEIKSATLDFNRFNFTQLPRDLEFHKWAFLDEPPQFCLTSLDFF